MKSLQLKREQYGDLAVLKVSFGGVESPSARDEILVSGVRSVISEIVELASNSWVNHRSIGLAVDIRTPDHDPPGIARANRAAFIEACHGLVHSFVAEERSTIVPVNLIISAESQSEDTLTTLDYLGTADAIFARGAMFDLRDAS